MSRLVSVAVKHHVYYYHNKATSTLRFNKHCYNISIAQCLNKTIVTLCLSKTIVTLCVNKTTIVTMP